MDTGTEVRLHEARRRIARLETKAKGVTAEARATMQQYIDDMNREEEAARAAVRQRAEDVDEMMEQLDASLDLTEHRVDAELAPTEGEFASALKNTLHRWDANLDRMQTKAAAKTDVRRERAEAAVADLRQRRLSIGTRVTAAGTAAGDGWRAAKAQSLAQLDELKAKADAAWRD